MDREWLCLIHGSPTVYLRYLYHSALVRLVMLFAPEGQGRLANKVQDDVKAGQSLDLPGLLSQMEIQWGTNEQALRMVG